MRGKAGDRLERRALARGRHRDGVSGPRACRAAVDRPQHLHGPRARRPLRLSRTIDKEIREAGRLMREIGFTSKVFTPHSIVGPAFRRRAPGRRDRPRHLQGGRPHRSRRADDGAVADRDGQGLSLRPRRCRASGRSILFIGHNIHHVYDIADRFVVLDRGKVALETDRKRDQARPSN